MTTSTAPRTPPGPAPAGGIWLLDFAAGDDPVAALRRGLAAGLVPAIVSGSEVDGSRWWSGSTLSAPAAEEIVTNGRRVVYPGHGTAYDPVPMVYMVYMFSPTPLEAEYIAAREAANAVHRDRDVGGAAREAAVRAATAIFQRLYPGRWVGDGRGPLIASDEAQRPPMRH